MLVVIILYVVKKSIKIVIIFQPFWCDKKTF